MKLNLHPAATKNFNERSTALLGQLSFKPEIPPKSTFKPDRFTSATITENDIIGDVKFSLVNSMGHEVGKFFNYGGKQLGLYGGNYQNLLNLSESLQKTQQLNKYVSVCFLVDSIFDWLRDKHIGKTSDSMVDYVLDNCEKNMAELEIWIPIAETYIQSKFDIGKITLVPISKDVLNQWANQSAEYAEFVRRHQKKLQGLTAATIKLFAEPQRAAEIAIEEAEKAISILRIFHPANLDPRLVSYWMLLGKENKDYMTYCVVQGDRLTSMVEKMLDNSGNCVLCNNSISLIKRYGLDILSDLLRQDDTVKTKFQAQLLDSIYLYSRNSLAKDVADKLVYILVALESILLKNQNEPIQQNISDRMALFIGNNRDEKLIIAKNVKNVYGLRSAFIHHGHSIDDIECLRTFMNYAWKFFQLAIQNANNFDTNIDFIDSIDKQKYS